MKKETVTTSSPAETTRFGVSFGEKLDGGVCIALTGALGSGKSVFARGVCKDIDKVEDQRHKRYRQKRVDSLF